MSNDKILKEMLEKYPIGSKIVIKEKPPEEKISSDCHWVKSMDRVIGMPLTISQWGSDGKVVYARVMESRWSFDSNWISPFEESVGCVCKSADLFVQGCKCGAIQRERSVK